MRAKHGWCMHAGVHQTPQEIWGGLQNIMPALRHLLISCSTVPVSGKVKFDDGCMLHLHHVVVKGWHMSEAPSVCLMGVLAVHQHRKEYARLSAKESITSCGVQAMFAATVTASFRSAATVLTSSYCCCSCCCCPCKDCQAASLSAIDYTVTDILANRSG